MRAVVLLAVSFGAGILSAWGIGGGTLLLLVLTLGFGVEQETAQGVNLLYFLPTAAAGLWFHRRRGLLEGALVRQAVPWGLVTAAAGAWAATVVDTGLLRRALGVLLLWAGVSLWRKKA